jgi:branched-chain amino acid aminotransferase
MQKIWFNGKMVPWKNANVHVLSHALHYGTGAFEGIRCYDTSQGLAIFRLEEHVERLMHSAKVLGLELRHSKKDLMDICVHVVKENRLKNCYIRPLVFQGALATSLSPKNSCTNLAVIVFPWKSYMARNVAELGVKLLLSDWKRFNQKKEHSNAKITGNYWQGILAETDAKRNGFDEAVLLDPKGFVCECCAQNIFLVKNKVLITPKTTHALNGITRKTILEIAKKDRIKTKEKNVTVKELLNADEVFLTGTATEIVFVQSINKKKIGNGKKGLLTKKIECSFKKIVSGKIKQYSKWLFFVT